MSYADEALANLSPEERELFELLLRQGGPNGDSSLLPPRRDAGSSPLSFAQQRLWFLDQLEPGNPFYNIVVAFRVQGPLQKAVLEHSFQEILRRHEILRTTCVTREGQPSQVIAPAEEFTLPVVNLRDRPPAEQEAEARRRATEEARRPFNLDRGPLLRVTLLQLGETAHILLLILHHFVADGWSMRLLLRELATLYEAFLTGAPSPLPELPMQYTEFAHWQRDCFSGEVWEKQLVFWKKQLAGAPPVFELPTDYPRPAVQTYRGALHAFRLPAPLSEAIRALSRREEVTLFMTLLAAFQTLLHRYTSQSDLVVGTTVSNRTRIETEGLIGTFANTIILRSEVSSQLSFVELLHRVREVALQAYANQDFPFEKLVEELQPERALSHAPLVQMLFVLHRETLEQTLKLPHLTLSRFPIEMGTAMVDLSLSIVDGEDELVGSLEYSTDLFDARTIQRLQEHFQTLLEGIVAHPERPIADLPLLTEAERHQVLRRWNDTPTDFPHDQCLHQLFEQQVERSPEAVAVVFEDQELTYRELNQRANQLAHHLRRLGVGPDVLVGIYLERSLEMVVGFLGILKAGGAYVPLDPAYPRQRLAFMLQDAQVPVLLTQEALVEGLPEHNACVVCLDAGWARHAQQPEHNPASGVRSDHLAYVIYTSGSTGQPKGVLIEHRALVNHMRWMQATFAWTPCDRILQKTPISFDASVWEFYAPLLAGGQLILARPGGHRDSAYLVEAIVRHQVTTLQLVPSLLQLLLEEKGLERCTCLRRVFCGGEALPVELQERFFARLGAELHNLYGPTEATIDATYWTCQRGSPLPTVPIGRPIANMQSYILDSRLQPVPVGVAGELYLGGIGLGRGYLNRPELTAEKFVPHPFSMESGARLYKTGDRVRYLADGAIEFLGRLDHQVKIRGYRLELGEIETLLGQHPAVRQVVVLVREDLPGDQRLVAYVVAEPQRVPALGELRSFLKEKLPGYMVPAAFVFLEALPLTPNGKVDRRALPAPDQECCDRAQAFVAPRTPVEELLTAIWSEVLQREQVSMHDDFFDLGGHSLLAIQVLSRVRSTFQVELPVRQLFETPTVAGLATAIAQGLAARADQEEMARLVAELEDLSEERTQFLLQAQP
jgi:amino acid adenylation domain-containing protein